MAHTKSLPDFSALRESIRQRMVEKSIPGMAVAAARDGEIIWEEGFGWASREKQLAATPHTMFSLASISKPITATGIMLLHQRKLVNLDRPANDYLGSAKIQGRAGSAKQATLRRLANHTAGLSRHFQFFYEDEPFRRPSMDETLLRYGNLVRKPGERCHYSNLGFGILDYIIERVSKKSFGDFMREEMFVPLGMTHSALNVPADLKAYASERYGPDGVAYPHYTTDHPGGTEVYSSAHDLMLWALFHLKAHLPTQKQILTDASIDEMQRSRMDPKFKAQFGVGWALNKNHHGIATVAHGGGMGGVSTYLMFVPKERCAVVALSNTNVDLAVGVAQEILGLLLPGFGKRRAAAIKKDEQKKKLEAKKKKTAPKLSGALRGVWKGKIKTYGGELDFTLDFRPSGDLHAQIGKQLKALVNEATLKDGQLRGHFIGDIGTEDANRRAYHLYLDLKRVGNKLLGGVESLHTMDKGDGGAAGKRMGNCVAHWTELWRQRGKR